MEGVYNINNQMAKIAGEHQLISRYVVEFNKNLKNQDKTFFKGLSTFAEFLEKDLLAHFRFEEVVVFPAALAGESTYGNILMVMSLQKDHGVLEDQLQHLKSELALMKTAHQKLTVEMINKFKEFLDALKNHVKRELTDLYPMMDANPKCKALLEIYAKEMTPSASAPKKF